MYPYAMQAEQVTEPWLHPELKVFRVDVRALVSKTWSEPSRRSRAMLTLSFQTYDASLAEKSALLASLPLCLRTPVLQAPQRG